MSPSPSAVIRTWAIAQGLKPSVRGRISADIVTAYKKGVHGGQVTSNTAAAELAVAHPVAKKVAAKKAPVKKASSVKKAPAKAAARKPVTVTERAVDGKSLVISSAATAVPPKPVAAKAAARMPVGKKPAARKVAVRPVGAKKVDLPAPAAALPTVELSVEQRLAKIEALVDSLIARLGAAANVLAN